MYDTFKSQSLRKSKWPKIYFLLTKGSTINDLGGGAEEKSKMNLFFPAEGLCTKFFSLEKGLENFFFSFSSGPPPRSLMVVP